MANEDGQDGSADDVFVVGRTGIASLLFAVTRPGDVSVLELDANRLRLRGRRGTRAIPVGTIESVDLEARWGWSGVRIATRSGAWTVSGLARRDAAAFAAVRDHRSRSWQRALGKHAPALRAIQTRLDGLSSPKAYVRHRAFAALRRDVEAAASAFPTRWPEWLADGPELRMLKRVQAFLDDPEGFRRRANERFLKNELARSREFLGDVEARPLTDEQRVAVCVDDDRNLVAAAAAGSGKTSVMVAKAGWVVERGDRRPEELLLAFGAAARDELAERVAERIAPAMAEAMTVKTFHAFGLEIIGKGGGRRLAVAKSAKDERRCWG